MRFEEPAATNRWDYPLFKVEIGTGSGTHWRYDSSFEQCFCLLGLNEKNLPLEDIYLWLFEGRSLSANESTESASLMPTDFLHVLDHVTKEVVTSVMQQQRTALPGDAFIVPNCILDDDKVLFTRQRSFAELSGLRRQFITYMKLHPSNDMSKFASLFINYLNANP
ncbi:unnamed protein product [Wuchereria bancrofti]|nr:unnamed protein product [Wuchereria bancrofti]